MSSTDKPNANEAVTMCKVDGVKFKFFNDLLRNEENLILSIYVPILSLWLFEKWNYRAIPKVKA